MDTHLYFSLIPEALIASNLSPTQFLHRLEATGMQQPLRME